MTYQELGVVGEGSDVGVVGIDHDVDVLSRLGPRKRMARSLTEGYFDTP